MAFAGAEFGGNVAHAVFQPEVGQHFTLPLPDGTPVPVVITAVSDAVVTFDTNHPLAGKTLIFDIELVSFE